MAVVRIPDENREITDPEAIREFLAPFGIWYEKWDVAGRLPEEASNEQILETYNEEIERLKEKGGFVTADVINVVTMEPTVAELNSAVCAMSDDMDCCDILALAKNLADLRDTVLARRKKRYLKVSRIAAVCKQVFQ